MQSESGSTRVCKGQWLGFGHPLHGMRLPIMRTTPSHILSCLSIQSKSLRLESILKGTIHAIMTITLTEGTPFVRINDARRFARHHARLITCALDRS